MDNALKAMAGVVVIQQVQLDGFCRREIFFLFFTFTTDPRYFGTREASLSSSLSLFLHPPTLTRTEYER
jgi:hypothetical protein